MGASSDDVNHTHREKKVLSSSRTSALVAAGLVREVSGQMGGAGWLAVRAGCFLVTLVALSLLGSDGVGAFRILVAYVLIVSSHFPSCGRRGHRGGMGRRHSELRPHGGCGRFGPHHGSVGASRCANSWLKQAS